MIGAACAPHAPATVAQTARYENGWLQYASPDAAGFSAEDLRAIRATADSARSAAVFVVYRGRVLAAWGDVQRRFAAHSVRKSLAGALYGIAVDRDMLPLDATLAQLGIDDRDTLSPLERRATVRDLVRARSGVYHPAAYADAGQNNARPARGSAVPGSRWFYNNWDFNVLESILERQANANLFDLYDRWLARPLGMEDFDPGDGFEVLEPSHSRFPAHTVRISARDLARVGQLYLDGGAWNGSQVIPRWWVDSSLAAHSDLGNGTGYGYLWWTYARGSLPNYPTLNAYDVALARGSGGQALFLVRGADLVVVHRGDSDNGVNVSGGVIWSLVERILAARRGEPRSDAELRPLTAQPFASQLPAPIPPRVVTLDSVARAGVAGAYSAGDLVITIFEHDRRLFINVPGEGEAEMFAEGPNAFFLPAVPGVRITLDRNAMDAVSGLALVIGRERIVARRR